MLTKTNIFSVQNYLRGKTVIISSKLPAIKNVIHKLVLWVLQTIPNDD